MPAVSCSSCPSKAEHGLSFLKGIGFAALTAFVHSGHAGDCSSGGNVARIGLFPDTVSDRAQRHVRDLMGIVAGGGQAAVDSFIPLFSCSSGQMLTDAHE